jgi:hypothetical protein
VENSCERKFRSLLHKLGYLKIELEDKTQELTEHEKKFNERYLSKNIPEEEEVEDAVHQNVEIHDQTSQDPNSTDDSSDPSSVSDTEKEAEHQIQTADPVPSEIKKLWRQIAFMTHPDKTKEDNRLSDLYKKAFSAYNSGKIEELLEVASQLSIKLDNPSQQLLDLLEKRTKDLEVDLSKVNNSILWEWASATEEKKEKIEAALHFYRKSKKKKKRRN